ncbi:rho guanine nucleotide exchange factor 28-like isoform X4 [Ptychodera flava]|uniref:rho guanine nucleotide exchange factor 28-like isoform X4 n=1 Tax=Ptychodera flava TaxID=63121 RepID=UPI003969E6EF
MLRQNPKWLYNLLDMKLPLWSSSEGRNDPDRETCRMAFSPQSSPIYGGKTLVVAFAEDSVPIDKELYLVFEGSESRHVTSANRLNTYTLQAVIPGHDLSETVKLSVCNFEENRHHVIASGEFTYMDDPINDFSRWLLNSVHDINALDNFETIIQESGFDYRSEDRSYLDSQLTSAFENSTLSPSWSIVGDFARLEHDPPPRETLLHFAIREGFTLFAQMLLSKAGSQIALRLPNKQGDLPRDLAVERGIDSLAESILERLQSNDESSISKWETEHSQTSLTTVRKHNIGTATITNKISDNSRGIDEDIKMLREVTSLMKGDARKRLKLAHTWSRVDEDEHEIQAIETTLAPKYIAQTVPPLLPHNHPHRHGPEETNNRGYDDSTGQLAIPTISVTDPLDNNHVLEENLRRLHDISEDIQKKRENKQTLLLVEDIRKDHLSRYSSSCPSLAHELSADSFRDTNLQSANSMVTVLPCSDDDDELSSANHKVRSVGSSSNGHPGSAQSDSEIRICVNDVTVDSSNTDFADDEAQDTLSSLDKHNRANKDTENHGWGAPIPASPKKKKPRRHSWCPQSEKVVKTQKKSYEEEDTVLTPSGRVMSVSSSEDDEDSSNLSEEEFHDAEDTVISGGEPNTSTETVTSALTPGNGSSDQPSPLDRPSSQASVRSLTDVGYEVAGLSDSDIAELDGRRRSLSQSSMDSAGDVLLPQQPLHKPIQKAVSVGALHMLKDGDHGHRQDSVLSQPETRKEKRTAKDTHLLLQELIKQHDQEQSKGREEEEAADVFSDDLYRNFMQRKRTKARMSLTEFLSDPRNFDNNEEQPVVATKQELVQSSKGESEKKSLGSKALSLFRMPSTRPRSSKSKDKDGKNKSTHQYMAISFSNSTKCDYCDKSLVNKDALQCQACLINVHSNSCKDNMGVCSKFARKQQKQTTGSFRDKFPSMNKQHSVSMTALQSSLSFTQKDRPRSVHIPIKAGQSNSLPSSYSASKLSTSPAKTSSLGRQRRELFLALHRQPSSSSCGSQPISEENEGDLTAMYNSQSNISETMSASMESLDEGTDEVDFDDDPDLMIKGPEPESWSVTVDKKTLKKMSHKDIKRQDVIYELIQTEKHHVRTLKIMQRIFFYGMQNELHMDQSIIDKMFPMLSEIMEINTAFLEKLKARQQGNTAAEKIGDVLVNQFSDKNGERMKVAYGIFCAHQREAVSIYKDLLKSDRKFQSFIKKCSQNALCRRWSIPECILAVTHRLTKYPLLIEAIIKVTKASKPDYQQLQQANTLVKNILNSVNAQVKDYEKEQRLLAIYNKIDARSSVTLRSGKKFKKSDILANNRKLQHEGEVQWRSARGKHTEVQAVLLTDVLTFLQDNNQKYAFLNLDQKVAVVPLQKLMVRNVATDKQSIYLISPHKAGPEMYEIMCNSTEERDLWRRHIEEAVKNCPDEDEGVVEEEVDEERKQAEVRAAKVTTLLDKMQDKDRDLNNTLSEKWNILVEMTELIGKAEASGIDKMSYKVESSGSEIPKTREILLAAIQEASRLTSAVYGAGGLSRSATSVGESESGTYQSPSLPKRAETFGGFDSSAKDQSILPKAGPLKKRLVTPHIDSETRSSSSPNLTKGESISIPDLQEHNRRGSATRSLSDADKKEAARRRDSGGSVGVSGSAFLHSALQRNSSDSLKYEKEERLSETGSDRDSTGELSTVTDSGVVALSTGYIPPTVEQVTSVAHLTHYLNSLLSVIAQRDTEYERMKTQMTEENNNKAKLEELQKELEKAQSEQEQKDEKLKNLEEQMKLTEIQLQQEKEEMTEVKERFFKEQEQLERSLQDVQEELKREREYAQQLKPYQDFAYLQPAHQRQGSSSSLGSYGEGSVSSVEWVSTTSHSTYGSTETLTDLSHSRTSGDVSVVSSHAGHGRSAGSDHHIPDFNNVLVPHLHAHMKPRAASEPVPVDVLDSTLPHEDHKGRRGSEGLKEKDKNLPIHLYSATNELGRQVVAGPQQQLPMKLMSKEKGKKGKKDKDKDKERGSSPNNHSHGDRTSKTASPTLPLPGSQIPLQFRNVAKPASNAPHAHSIRTGFQRSQTETTATQIAVEKTHLYHQQSLPTQPLADPNPLSKTMPPLPYYQPPPQSQQQQIHQHHHQQLPQQQQPHPQQQQQHQPYPQQPHPHQQPTQEPPPSPDQEVMYF